MARGEFLLVAGRVLLAQARRVVPADLRADPLAAAGVLVKIHLRRLDRRRKGVVVGLAAHHPLDFIGTLPCPSQHATEGAAGRAQRVRDNPGRERLEAGLVAVAALVALERELKPTVGRNMVVVGSELDECHDGRRPLARFNEPTSRARAALAQDPPGRLWHMMRNRVSVSNVP
jgi:hypothetical protein